MKAAALAIGMLLALMLAVTIYGAIMATDIQVNQKYASAAFILLSGMTFISFILWTISSKLVPAPAAVTGALDIQVL